MRNRMKKFKKSKFVCAIIVAIVGILISGCLGIGNNPPDAKILVNKTSADLGEKLEFNGSLSTDDKGIVEYFWDFGDNNTDNKSYVTYSYQHEGNYTVILRVKDTDGAIGEDQIKIVISKHEFLFVEMWHEVSGQFVSGNKSAIPYINIDFPFYYIDTQKRIIRYWGENNITTVSKQKALIAYGTDLKHDIGGGMASEIYFEDHLPKYVTYTIGERYNTTVHFNITITIRTDTRVFLNNSTEIPVNGILNYTYFYTKNFTKQNEYTIVVITEIFTFTNYGLWLSTSVVKGP